MTIDTTKITPEKLAEMNDSLIVDNNHLRVRVKALTEQVELARWREEHTLTGCPELFTT